MKIPISFLLIIVLSLFAVSVNANVIRNKSASDTVYFTFNNDTGNYVDLTISILSPVAVTSLDFSTKLNITHLTYDTTLPIATYFDFSYGYYGPTDSTVSFTSYSSQNYINHTPLVKIRFKKLHSLLPSDFYPLQAFVNGDAAKTKLIMPPVTGIQENSKKIEFDIYPNPTKEFLNIKTEKSFEMNISDLLGNKIISSTILSGKENRISLKGHKAGIYLLKASQNGFVITRKIIITD